MEESKPPRCVVLQVQACVLACSTDALARSQFVIKVINSGQRKGWLKSMWKLAKKSKKRKAELQILEALSGLMMSVDEPLRLLGADSGVQPQPIMVIGKLAIPICTYALVL